MKKPQLLTLGLATLLSFACTTHPQSAQIKSTDGSENTANNPEVTLVTVAFFRMNEEGNLAPLIDPYTQTQGKIVFDMSDDVFYWSRLADGDRQNPEDGHPHYNAAADMFYIDGVFSWVEYGPRHSQEDIAALVAEGTAGTRKAVTFGTENARFYRDHSGLHLQIESVE